VGKERCVLVAQKNVDAKLEAKQVFW